MESQKYTLNERKILQEYRLFFIEIRKCNNLNERNRIIRIISESAGCTIEDAETVVKKFLSFENCNDKKINNLCKDEWVAHCPTCSSTNVHKISEISKVGSVLAFGIFSQKIKRQFHCDNCGYEW